MHRRNTMQGFDKKNVYLIFLLDSFNIFNIIFYSAMLDSGIKKQKKKNKKRIYLYLITQDKKLSL